VVKGLEIIEGTIMENIRLGRAAITLGEARRALDAVGLLDALAALPDGLQTRLSAGGAPLSLGQARRLMIARAIAGRPRLLVLDEALDGLDLDAGRQTRGVALRPLRSLTLIVVTHSQEVAAYCDRAVVLSGGKTDRSTAMANGRSPNLEDLLRESR
jgi:ABC-type bacteriocin/lantibiotic exporter with double-glycine peptidase domain